MRRSRFLKREAIDGYIFIMPWLLGFLLFTFGPMVASVFISLTEWDLLTPAQWVGLDNFRTAFRDELFWKSLYNTAYYTFLAIPLQMIVSVLLAVALNTKIHGTRLYRTLYYIPSLTPVVASSVLWTWFFNPNYGIANAFLKLLGLPPQMWFLDIQMAKPTFVLISLWGMGSSMIIILAGLQGVPQELYEAAEIDGANLWHRFRNVTLPLITPVIFFNLILGIIGSFQVFTSAFIITRGGPYNATLFYFLYLYRNAFEYFKMGYASALAWLLFFIILAFTLLQLRLSDRWVYYEGKLR
jgi:multiple sugar transport system permease protein